jgi:hypothetical protein
MPLFFFKKKSNPAVTLPTQSSYRQQSILAENSWSFCIAIPQLLVFTTKQTDSGYQVTQRGKKVLYIRDVKHDVGITCFTLDSLRARWPDTVQEDTGRALLALRSILAWPRARGVGRGGQPRSAVRANDEAGPVTPERHATGHAKVANLQAKVPLPFPTRSLRVAPDFTPIRP